ncbi:MAG: preprotein translocase subunit SecY, partial [Candidatus Ryanbacteria bacterium]|nr:preprotein translocase subunit SecY [Candidatus Ryanbacteria bacterium]
MNELLGVFKDRDLRRRILWTLGFLAFFRLLAVVPVPGIDSARLKSALSGNNFFGLLNIFSGGALENVSIIMLGVGPYITASIIMQLLTMIFPSLKEIYQEAGETGRRKFNQYSRLLTVPLSFLQGYGLLTLLIRQGLISHVGTLALFTNVLIVAAGSILLMWLGELISEYGVGNGVSLVIFAGIVARIPRDIGQIFFQFDRSLLPTIIGFLVVAPIVVAGVVLLTEAERPIPVSYAKRVRGMRMYGGISTYLPIRVNQAGVIPIIFAISLLLFPSMIGNFLATSSNAILAKVGTILSTFLTNQLLYGVSYFLLVFLFTYFYTAITFDPDAISSNLQKQGGFIPGIRPGPSTAEFLSRLITRITFVGGLFLGIIAILPLAMQVITRVQTLTIGGTALLIVVSVVIETTKQIRAQLTL